MRFTSPLDPVLESVYQAILAYELINTHRLSVERQVPISVTRKNIKLELGFLSDLILEVKVLVELKLKDELAPMHLKQAMTYLRLTNLKPGLLINFNESLSKNRAQKSR